MRVQVCFTGAFLRRAALAGACLGVVLPVQAASTVWDSHAQIAAQWLSTQAPSGSEQQNQIDGSWGAADATKPVATSEAVAALRGFNQRSVAYYAGIVWLSDHHFDSVDAVARRVIALSGTGANLTGDIAALQAARRTGNTTNGGWGLSGSFNGSALDTALVLQALQASGSTVSTTSAVAFLKSSQLTGSDKGWPIGQSAVSDPTTTAQVILALQPLVVTDGTLNTSLSNAATTLAAQVTTSSPAHLKGLAALALLKLNASSAAASSLLTSLNTQQAADGSFGNAYSTAMALRAYSLAMQRDLAAQRTTVDVPDSALRAAINQALGRSALDELNRGELASLTSLNATGKGIKSLVGLELATNLKDLDVSDNQIPSYAPIASLALTSVNCSGNPASNCSTTMASADGGADTPLPAWALWVLGATLLGVVRKRTQA